MDHQTERNGNLAKRRYNHTKRKNIYYFILLFFSLAFLGALIWWSRQASHEATSQRRGRGGLSVPVAIATVEKGNVHQYLNALGTVTPVATVTVRSRVDGQLLRATFSEGQRVARGDLLAEIDPRPYQVLLAQAEGSLARDQALLANAKSDLERYRTLFEQDSIAKQQLDTQQSLVRQYEGNIKSDEAQIENSKLQLSYTNIVAPISGRAGLRQVDPGNLVHASDSSGIVTLTQLQPMTVMFALAEDDIPLVTEKLKQHSEIPVEAYDRAQTHKLATGKLITLDNQIDVATGTVKAKAQFDNSDEALFPSQFVNIRLLLNVLTDQAIIPSSAVQRGADGLFVYIVNSDQTVSVRSIKSGVSEGEHLAVESGLNVGDVIVSDGADKLREGAKVQIPGATPSVQSTNPDDAGSKHGSGGWRKKSSDADANAKRAEKPESQNSTTDKR